jgi:ATP-binding cassette subfamily F protein uup
MAVLVDLESVSASRPGRPLFDDLSLTLATGDRLGVVGLNGSGKSTLLRIMAGIGEPETGAVRRGRGVRVALLDQRPNLPAGTVRAAVGDSWEAAAILDRLGMAALSDSDVSTLSGGQAKRVALARVLVDESDLLILDEPTNHLDIGAIVWLERRLAAYRGGLVMVSHDRHLLDRVTTRMLEVDRGHSYVHEGGYASYLESRAERAERAAVAESTRRNLARRELAWLRRGAPARTRKPQARVDAARAVIDRRPESPTRAAELILDRFGTPRLGDKVLELKDVGFSYNAIPVLDGVDLLLEPRARLGLVGPNGTGKSTLLDLLAGRRPPSSGTVDVGPTVRVGYYDQLGADLNPDATVRDLVAGPHRVPGAPEDLRLMERFWFGGETQWATVRTLSGGERRRLQLLLVLAERPNVLLLDEPTNDLDLDTLRALEDFLDDWPGALVAVSHDRAFLERSVVELVALDGRGRIRPVPGGVPTWVAEAVAGIDQPAAGRPPRPTSPQPASRPARSPSTLRRLLGQAERNLTDLEQRRHELEEAMNTARADHETLARVGAELTDVAARLSDAEERWLKLAEESETGER